MTFVDIMSMVGAVVIVILAMALLLFGSRWYARRMGAPGVGRYVKIIDKTALSQGSALYIIKAGGCYHMLGISEKTVTYLHELPDFDEFELPGADSPASFTKVMRGVIGKRGGGN